MSAKQRGLGRGLGALIGDFPEESESGAVTKLPLQKVEPNPDQPRRTFDEEELQALADSIAAHGILQPLAVRASGGGFYQIIAGERRWRAARMAGLSEVPVVVLEADDRTVMELALVENLQRRDLDFIEEATGISQLIRMFGMSQEEAARRLGKSQSAVANKLRLLRLPSDVLDVLRANGLTERHGRALLRLPDANAQRAALQYIIENGLTVAATDEYIELLLTEPAEEQQDAAEPKRTFVLKDVRIFLNSLSKSLDLMKQGGIDAGMKREETEDSLILTISIPKNKAVTAT